VVARFTNLTTRMESAEVEAVAEKLKREEMRFGHALIIGPKQGGGSKAAAVAAALQSKRGTPARREAPMMREIERPRLDFFFDVDL